MSISQLMSLQEVQEGQDGARTLTERYDSLSRKVQAFPDRLGWLGMFMNVKP